jgi:Type IV secretion system pilin
MRSRIRRALPATALAVTTALLVLITAVAANAITPGAAPQSLNAVINDIVRWLVGLLVSLATLFLTIGGVRDLLAGGDPGEVGKAKDTLKYAAIGYGIAIWPQRGVRPVSWAYPYGCPGATGMSPSWSARNGYRCWGCGRGMLAGL